MKKRIINHISRRTVFTVLLLICILFMPVLVKKENAEAAEDIYINKTNLSIGERARIYTEDKKYKFYSSDSSIAFVSTDGIITGKKEGDVIIKAEKPKGNGIDFPIHVRLKEGAPKVLPVCLDEVELIPLQIKKADQKMVFSARVMNNSESGRIYKVKYYYSINSGGNLDEDLGENLDEDLDDKVDTEDSANNDDNVSQGGIIVPQTQKKTVCITAVRVDSGKKSKKVECEGDVSGEVNNMELEKIVLYSGCAKQVYEIYNNDYSFGWGYDRRPPVISGWVENKSYCSQDVYQVCYLDMKDSYDFKKYITITDNKDINVKVKVNTDKINWRKNGTYKVYYTAEDSAGNKARTWANVQVYVKGQPEEMADEVLSSIINEKWSDVHKARVIYSYVQSHHSYIDSGSREHWRTAGARALIYQSGDCYSYYSMSRLLLTRAGIPNVMIRRYPASPGNNHWWNLVYADNGWYHFDTTPRLDRGYFCLMTDGQLNNYSASDFLFNKVLYPERSERIISRNPK